MNAGPVTRHAPPGWHPDPYDPNQLRWWDGTSWTEHRAPAPPASPAAPPVHQPPADALALGLQASLVVAALVSLGLTLAEGWSISVLNRWLATPALIDPSEGAMVAL